MVQINSDKIGKALPGEAIVILAIVQEAVEAIGTDATPGQTGAFLWFGVVSIVVITAFVKFMVSSTLSLGSIFSSSALKTNVDGTVVLITVLGAIQAFSYTLGIWAEVLIPNEPFIPFVAVIFGLMSTAVAMYAA